MRAFEENHGRPPTAEEIGKWIATIRDAGAPPRLASRSSLSATPPHPRPAPLPSWSRGADGAGGGGSARGGGGRAAHDGRGERRRVGLGRGRGRGGGGGRRGGRRGGIAGRPARPASPRGRPPVGGSPTPPSCLTGRGGVQLIAASSAVRGRAGSGRPGPPPPH